MTEPEAWKTVAPGPYATIRKTHGTVTIWALGKGQHLVKAEGKVTVEETIEGHRPAHERAAELAAMLD